MNSIIQSRLMKMVELCKKRNVRCLALFGSSTGDRFDPSKSDLDFIVEFNPMSPIQHADKYFGLLEDLQQVFEMPIDLIELGPIRNPFFRKVIEETQVVHYEAA